jgi:hypothetical protein
MRAASSEAGTIAAAHTLAVRNAGCIARIGAREAREEEAPMAMLEDSEAHATLEPLYADQVRAERLLFALATDLRHLRIDEGTRTLHLRALELKRVVARWPKDHPAADVRQELCDEVLSLHAEARVLVARSASAR